MRKTLLSTLIASLFAAAPALAQTDDPFRVTGSVTAGGIYTSTDATNPAKLREYQDLDSGLLSNIAIQGRNSRSWVDAYGENFGRDDQYFFLRGGMYDVFKYGLYSNQMPHNYGFDMRSPYGGIGNNQLVASFPNTNLSGWTRYTLGTERTDTGGMIEWQRASPWYFRADGNQVKFEGTKYGSAANGTSPGNGFVDLAIPMQWTTNNVGAEAGYQTRSATFALRYDYSRFENAYDQLNWTNPYFGGNNVDSTYLAPSNDFNKITATGSLRQLPWNSVVSARYTWAKTTSTVDLATQALNTGPVYRPTLSDIGTFNGEHINQTFQLSWTATPTRGLDTRVYYFWSDLENNSDLVEFGHAPTQPLASGLGCQNYRVAGVPTQTVGNCDNELFSYRKSNVGFDAWWRFAKGQRIGGGYDYLDLTQDRFDYDEMTWNRFWVEYKNTALDNFSGRVKYTYLDRNSNLVLANSGLNANDNLYLLRFTSAFDMQDSTTNQLKVNLDWSPVRYLDLAFEGKWSKIDYNDVTLGRTEAKRQEYYLNVAYGAPNSWRVNAFVDYEKVDYPSNHRYIGTVAGGPTPPSGWCTAANPNCYDPASAPFYPLPPPPPASPFSTATSYNWNSATNDETWSFGIGLDAPVMANLLVNASYLYVKTEGSASFSTQTCLASQISCAVPLPLPIDNFDNTKRQSFNLKGIYTIDKSWSLTGGYAYESYRFDDIAFNGYQYTIPYPAVNNNTGQSYLSGYYANQNYNANIFYLLLTYKF